MSSRTIRRAAERHQAKLAAKANQTQLIQVAASKVMTASAGGGPIDNTLAFLEPIEDLESPPPISDARLKANRANSQLSTGPTSVEGKAKSSLNAVKTGLTGRTVLLPADDAEIYRQHVNRIFSDLTPATDRERAIAQTIADTEWRLLRIAPLEASIYAIGRRDQAHMVLEESPADGEALLMGYIFQIYRKDLSNIALQERRLRSQRTADLAELKALQQERADKEKEAAHKRESEVRRANTIVHNANKFKLEFHFAEFGFDFSIDELLAYNERNFRHGRLAGTILEFDKFLASHRKEQKTA
jgi:hypothetical protein